MARALYPGTFDPIHNGHVDIATRVSALFDEVVIGVYDSSPKSPLFETAQRVSLAQSALAHLPNVRVMSYRGLTVTFAREIGAVVMVRGLRAISDFEIEFQMALTNKKLAPEIEFISLMTSLQHAYLSSTILKEVAMLGGDVSELAPATVQAALRARFADSGHPTPGVVKMESARLIVPSTAHCSATCQAREGRTKMDMLSLLDELETLLKRSTHIPGSRRLLIDEDALRQIVAEMRSVVPDEVRQGQRIASEREHILADARAQAHRMIEEAQAQLSNRADEQSIVQTARERARTIIAEAEQRAANTQAQANQYTVTQLNALENRLQRLLREVQAGQRYLAQAPQSGAEGDHPKTARQS